MERPASFYVGPGYRLAGILSVPEDWERSGKRLAGVVLCQGPGGNKNYLTPEVSKWLAGEGYVALRFDCRGFAESEGPRNRLIPMEQVDDIRSALTFLQQQREVDPVRMGLWGSATGGANASYAAGVDSRVKAMVSLSGMGDLGRWLRSMRRFWEWRDLLKTLEEDRVTRVLIGKSREVDSYEIIRLPPATSGWPERPRGKLRLESAEAMIDYRPESVVDKIAPRAAMWICAGRDTLLPNEESRSMYEKAREPKRLVVLQDLEHYEVHHGPGLERVMRLSTEWFDTFLKGG